MGKKKKKSQKKKKSDEKLPALSLGDTLSAAKKNETTLQTLLKGVSEQGFVHPKKEEEEKITPQLSHESRSQMAAEYIKEDVLLTQRERKNKKSRTRLVPQVQKETKPSKEKKPSKGKKASKKKTSKKPVKPVVPPPAQKSSEEVQTEKQSDELIKPVVPPPAQKPSKEDQTEIESEELIKPVVPPPAQKSSEEAKSSEASTPPSTIETEPLKVKKENIYIKLTEFFEGLLRSYNDRYDRWENSISAILAILRKMRKITKKNTEDLTGSINNIFEKIQVDLGQFKIKRTEIEKVAGVDVESMSGKFKRVLGLLELQVKEYQLKRDVDNYIREVRYY